MVVSGRCSGVVVVVVVVMVVVVVGFFVRAGSIVG